MSANELAKGLTRLLTGKYPIYIPKDVRAAHDELIAKRKLNSILSKNRVAKSGTVYRYSFEIKIRNGRNGQILRLPCNSIPSQGLSL